ncbi:IS1182 family transposase, partial [Pseudomonas sp. IT-P258]|uniref:IS1182 family transposase n=1 Tax=Pseudomonas sp. IT-P258 TaxID=3026447 RepID=UPI0039DF6621
INRYLTALDEADQQEPSIAQPKATHLQEKIDKLKAQMKELQVIEIQLNESPDKQVSLTDPDARSMMTRGTGIVGYNVQTAVDTQHHLIVAHEVTNVGSDRDQLSSMAKQARDAMAPEALSVVADRGYFKSEEILACHDANITAYVPKPMTSGAKADGRFNNDAFIYDAAKNEYICPAGEALIWRYTNVEKGLTLHRYWSSKCRGCAMKPQCTPSTERRVRRWEHEAVLEEMQTLLSNAPEMMRIRKRTVEHPFGTLKQWMGATHFLTRKLNGVSAEMSLNVLAYNLKRVMKIIGTTSLMKALTA